jgi:hypothetical protein
MNSFLYSLAVVACTMLTLTLSSVAAFAPGSMTSRQPSFLSMAPMPMPMPMPVSASASASATMMTQLVSVAAVARSDTTMMNQVDAGIENYLSTTPSTANTYSSMTLSLQERRAPTAEEVASKKFNFNVIFWGGGIIAPFLATVFYFGFKFWEK